MVCLPYAAFLEEGKLLRWVWREGYLPFWLQFSGAVIVAGICSAWLFKLKQYSWLLFLSYSCVIFLCSTYLAMSEKRHFLLLAVFLQGAILLVISEWMRVVLRQPFYHSRRKWWESHPKPIPEAKAVLFFSSDESEGEPVILANLGSEGCFVFSQSGRIKKKPKAVEISAPFTNKNIRARVKVARFTSDRLGVGLQFIPEEPRGDWSKDLDDMIEGMRRTGYVSN